MKKIKKPLSLLLAAMLLLTLWGAALPRAFAAAVYAYGDTLHTLQGMPGDRICKGTIIYGDNNWDGQAYQNWGTFIHVDGTFYGIKTLNTPEPGKGWAADRDYIYDRNEGDSITASHSINLYLLSCPDLQLNGKNTVVTADADVIYSGRPVAPQVTVTYNGEVLSPDYYTVSGNSRTDVGEYTLTVTGKNGYSGSVNGSWRIVDPENVDLTGLHTALDRANALDAAAYVDFSGVTAAVDAALDALAVTDALTQARVDALAAEIRIAIARLTAKTVAGGAAASVEGNHHYPNKAYGGFRIEALGADESTGSFTFSSDVSARTREMADANAPVATYYYDVNEITSFAGLAAKKGFALRYTITNRNYADGFNYQIHTDNAAYTISPAGQIFLNDKPVGYTENRTVNGALPAVGGSDFTLKLTVWTDIDQTNVGDYIHAGAKLKLRLIAFDKSALRSAIDTYVFPRSFYTPESYEAYLDALGAAGDVNVDPTPLQGEIDDAAQALRDAIAGLVFSTELDFTELDAAIKEAGALDSAAYVSFTEVTEAVAAAVDAIDGGALDTQEKIDDMAGNIRLAIGRLVEKRTPESHYVLVNGDQNYPNIAAGVSRLTAYGADEVTGDYTYAVSASVWERRMNDAQAPVATYYYDVNEISSFADLASKKGFRLNYTVVNRTYADIWNYRIETNNPAFSTNKESQVFLDGKPNGYNENVALNGQLPTVGGQNLELLLTCWTDMAQASTYNGQTLTYIHSATKLKLRFVPYDKTNLFDAINTPVEHISQYTPESLAAYRDALDAATAVAAKTNADQTEIDAAADALRAAINALTLKTFTVTFNGYLGAPVDAVEVPYGSAATAPELPAYIIVDAAAHAHFTGWDQSFDRVIADLTVAAQYETAAHAVTRESTEEQFLVSAATCTDRAVYYKSYVCGFTGTETFAYGPTPTGHVWDVEEIASPTPSKDGTMLYACTVCGLTRTEAIPYIGSAMPSGELLGRFFSTDNVWWDAANGQNYVQWQMGDYPAYEPKLGMTYFNGMYVRLGNEAMLSGVTRDTGLTVAFNYRPNFSGDHRHILSIGKNAYGDIVNNHFYISGATSWFSDGHFPVVGWVNDSGTETIKAYPAGLSPVLGYEYNVVVSIDHEEGVVFYVDGIRYETVYVDSNLNEQLPNIRAFLDEVGTYTNNYVGCSRWTGDAKLEGYLSDLRFYGASMTDRQAYDLVADMMGSSFDLTKPSFTAVAYHCQDPATGTMDWSNRDDVPDYDELVYGVYGDAYRNLAYAPYDQTEWVEKEWHNCYTTLATPANVVMVYDGVPGHEPMSPIMIQLKGNGSNGPRSVDYLAVDEDVPSLAFRRQWAGYMDESNGGYLQWPDAGEGRNWINFNRNSYINYQVRTRNDLHRLQTENQDNKNTRRDYGNAFVYVGQGNFTTYYEKFSETRLHYSHTWRGSGTQVDDEKIPTKGNIYVLSYKPVYDAMDGLRAEYASVSPEAWTYTESSYANYLTYLRRVALCNPNLYDYANRGVETATVLCAAAIRQVAEPHYELVKKTATVKFVDEDSVQVGNDYTVVFGGQVEDAKPAAPAKAYDETYHYHFDAWADIDWEDYRTMSSGVIIALDPNYTPERHVYEGTEPTYYTDGVGICSCAKADTVPALQTLINLDDVTVEGVGGTKGKIALAPTKENDISFEIVGFLADGGDHTLYKRSAKPEAATGTLKLNGVRISRDSGDAGKIAYKFTKMDFTALPTFYALVKVTGTGNHKYAENEIYTYQKVTLVPSKNVFFDDAVEAIAYTNSANADSGYGVWSRITDSGSVATDAVDSFGDLETAQADTENSVRYSFGDAHQVSVSDSLGKNWPKAQFTFTGSGFDVISVTDSDSGVFTVNVYQGTEARAGKPFKTAIVNNYYGYRYAQLFYDRNARRFVDTGDANGTVLYAALPTTPEESRVYSGLGSLFYTMDAAYAARDEQDSPVVAYGWIQSGSSDVLYQVPCLNLDLGTVGTYTVVIEPRFTASYGHYNESNGVRYYNFTLDGVRIYNPADGSNEALALYEENGEKYTAYELIRKTIPDEELVLIDGMEQLAKENISAYLAGAPKNELYLRANGTAAFDVDFTGLTDARIGLKAANGTGCSVTISNGKTTKTVPVTSATEQYVSVGDLLTPGETTTLTVTNNGEGILSITRLMTATNAATPTQSGAPRRSLSIGPKTAKTALAAVAMLNADLTIDSGTIGTTAADDGTVTLTLKTSDAAQTVVIRDGEGRVVDPEAITFSIDETGVKNWTIVLSEEQSGTYAYTLQAEYENGYAPEQPTVVTVTVTLHGSEAGEPESTDPEEPKDGETGSASRLLRGIKGIFERLRDLIRKLLALFR